MNLQDVLKLIPLRWETWRGAIRVVEGETALITDGHVMVDTDQADREAVKELQIRRALRAPVRASKVTSTWQSLVGEGLFELHYVGFHDNEIRDEEGKRFYVAFGSAAFTRADETPIVVNAEILRYLTRVVPFDTLHGSRPHRPVVCYRAEVPVASLMPVPGPELLESLGFPIAEDAP